MTKLILIILRQCAANHEGPRGACFRSLTNGTNELN